MANNLPVTQIQDSAAGTKLFFDTYGKTPLEFAASDVDSSIAFFTSKGFDEDAALVVATVLLKQAKIDGTPVFKILDTLKSLDGLELSQVVGEVLNNNRVPTSALGFRTDDVKPNQTRNISA
jgi:hypothetical protein